MSDFDKVGLLTRRDMELEAQLEGITNKAVKAFQKRDPSPEPLPIKFELVTVVLSPAYSPAMKLPKVFPPSDIILFPL
jgi:hypothetical protein